MTTFGEFRSLLRNNELVSLLTRPRGFDACILLGLGSLRSFRLAHSSLNQMRPQCHKSTGLLESFPNPDPSRRATAGHQWHTWPALRAQQRRTAALVCPARPGFGLQGAHWHRWSSACLRKRNIFLEGLYRVIFNHDESLDLFVERNSRRVNNAGTVQKS